MTTISARSPMPRFLRQLGIDTAYNLTGLAVAVASFVLIVVGFALGTGLAITLVGLPILATMLVVARGFGDLGRIWTPRITRRSAYRPGYPPAPVGAGRLRRAINPIMHGQSWLDALAAIIDLPLAIIAFTVSVVWWSLTLGGLTWAAWGWAVPGSGPTINDRPAAEYLGFGHGHGADIVMYLLIGVIFGLTLPLAIRGVALLRATTQQALLSDIGALRASGTTAVDPPVFGRGDDDTATEADLRAEVARLSTQLASLRAASVVLDPDPKVGE